MHTAAARKAKRGHRRAAPDQIPMETTPTTTQNGLLRGTESPDWKAATNITAVTSMAIPTSLAMARHGVDRTIPP
jgi:hypothetical protein